MIKFTKTFKSILLLSFLLSMTNCVTNEAEDNLSIQSSNEAKIWFDSHKEDYNETIIKYARSLQWENAIVSNGKDGEVVEVPFTLLENLRTSNENAALQNDSHRLVFVKDGQQNFKTYYMQIFAEDQNSDKSGKSPFYYGATNNFSGKVFSQDLSTNDVTSINFKNGKNVKSGTSGKWREETYDCTFLGYWDGSGSFHPIKLLYCEGGGFDDGEPYPQPGGGGGGSGSGSGQETSVFINIEGQKVNPKEETKCFDKTKPATLTIYVQQPNENTRDKMGENSVGHTFVGIEQGGTERLLGFYPDSPNASLISSQTSEIHDNSNTLFHVSISIGIDAGTLTNVINYIDNYPKTYDLNNYNCTDFALGVADKGGLSLPKTTGSYNAVIVKFKGRNPGDLGQDIRNMTTPSGVTKNTTKGNAPKKKGVC